MCFVKFVQASAISEELLVAHAILGRELEFASQRSYVGIQYLLFLGQWKEFNRTLDLA